MPKQLNTEPMTKKELARRYYEKNKKRVFQRTIICECGCKVNFNYRKRHKYTFKHITKMQIKQLQANQL